MSRYRSCIVGWAAALVMLVHMSTASAKPAPRNVSMHFSRTDVAVVLGSLATQVGFDLVVAPEVKGEIDVNLTNVNWETGLEAIAAAHGLTYHWRDDVLIVMQAGAEGGDVMMHRVVNLRYADPAAVKAVLAGVLSAGGKVDVLAGPAPTSGQGAGATVSSSPVLVISEAPQAMPAILELVDSLDVPRPQFEIGVKFIETNLDNEMAVGLSWPTRIAATLASRDSTSGGTTTATHPAAEYPIPSGKIWRFGTLSIDQLSGVLEMLDQRGNSRLLSDPRVTVLENQKAIIKVTTTIPVQTLNRFTEGAVIQDIVDFQNLDVGITLTVTPRRNDSNQVTLEVEPTAEEITGFTGPANNQRPITAKRTVHTSVRVGNNETIVIGGLMRETDFDTKTRVFFLGDIPILGALFTHHRHEKKKTDLLIFITPRILESVAAK